MQHLPLPLPPDLIEIISEHVQQNHLRGHLHGYRLVHSIWKKVIPCWSPDLDKWAGFTFPGHERLRKVENWRRDIGKISHVWVYESARLCSKTYRSYPRSSIDEVVAGKELTRNEFGALWHAV
jgi:hypothetical protein